MPPEQNNPSSCNTEIKVVRNDQEITFSPTAFERGKRAEAGIMYPYTGDITEATLTAFRKFVGAENFFGMLNENWRLWMQGFFNAVLKDSNGVFDPEKFKAYVIELAVSSDTIKDLQAKLEKLTDSLNALVPASAQAQAEGNLAKVAELMGQFMPIVSQMKAINLQIANKKRPRANADEDDTPSIAPPVNAPQTISGPKAA